jgi:hypothetical protein
MTMSKRLRGAFIAAVVLTIVTIGCDEEGNPLNPAGAICCTEFKVGADLSGVDFGVDASIRAQFNTFAQAAADLSGAATGALDDVSGACKGIAQVGGANGKAVEPGDPAARVKFWCDLAVARITAAFQPVGGAKAALTIIATPPQCRASFRAEANCQANCNVDASCDVKAKPPVCEGGRLEVSCSGGCQGTAEAPSISCEGGCTGKCEGTCSAEGNVAVDCNGNCDGECAAGGEAGGSGIQADGTCNGTCKGTCTAKPDVKLNCQGQCKGSCDAKCEPRGGTATVKCDGKCEGTAEPLSCKGGELKAQCQADANCTANCKASASAKAECTPPKLDIAFTASAQAGASGDAALMVEALRLHLPRIVLVFRARGQSFVDLVGKVVTSGSATLNPARLGVRGTACITVIAPVVVQAGANVKAAVESSGSVVSQFQL